MFHWLKKRLVAWVDEQQRREIVRLKHESQRLSAEIEQATGQPFRSQPEEPRRLAEKAREMDLEQVREVSILHPENLEMLIKEISSAQDRPSKEP